MDNQLLIRIGFVSRFCGFDYCSSMNHSSLGVPSIKEIDNHIKSLVIHIESR